MSRKHLLCLVLAVGLVVVGCSRGGDAPEGSSGSSDDGASVVSDRGGFDPLDGFDPDSDAARLTGEERAVITNAEYRLVRSCMADEGFDYPAPPEGAVVPRATPFLAPAELRRSGYGYDWEAAERSFSAANPPDGPVDPTEGMSSERAEAFGAALSGPPDGPVATLDDGEGGATSVPLQGCMARAREELFGSVLNALRFDRADLAISGEALSEALQADEDYAEAAEAWRECMTAAGQDPEFMAPTNDYGIYMLHSQMLNAALDGGEAITTEREMKTAGDDADCQESTGLFDLREALLPDVRDALYRGIDLESHELDAFSRAVFERAKNIE